MKPAKTLLWAGAALMAFNLASANVSLAQENNPAPKTDAVERWKQKQEAWERKTPLERFNALVERARRNFKNAMHPEQDPHWDEYTKKGGMDATAISVLNLQEFIFVAGEANSMFKDPEKQWNAEDFLSMTRAQLDVKMCDILLNIAVGTMERMKKWNQTGSSAISTIRDAERYMLQRNRDHGGKGSWELLGETRESIIRKLVANHRIEAKKILDLSGNDPDSRGFSGIDMIREASSHVFAAGDLAGQKGQWEDIGWSQTRINELAAQHHLVMAQRDLDEARSGFSSSGIHFEISFEISEEGRLSKIESAMDNIRIASKLDGVPVGWHRIVSSQNEIDGLAQELGGDPDQFRLDAPVPVSAPELKNNI